jgi:uncharacterized protein YjbI with pentapeptide repeats
LQLTIALAGAVAILTGVLAGAGDSQTQPPPPLINVIEVEAVADTYVRADLEQRRNDNYGCQHFVAVGTSRNGGPDAMRSLVLFDLPDIDAGQFVRARLEMTVFGYDGTGVNTHTVDVHRVIESEIRTPWLEGLGFEEAPERPLQAPPVCEGTDAADGVAWTGWPDTGDSDAANNTSQPDFDPDIVDRAVIDQASVGNGDVVGWDVTRTVGSWLDRSERNYGFVLLDPTGGPFRGVRFGAREGFEFGIEDGAPAVAAPRLILEFGAGGGCPTVEFTQSRLVGVPNNRNVTEAVSVDLQGEYDIILTSRDHVHASSGASTQPNEQWYLEAVNIRGRPVFQTPPTDDLPDDVVVQNILVGRFDMTEVVAVTGRHAAVGPSSNSVDAVSATFFNASCIPLASDRCLDVGDLRDLHGCDLSGQDLSDQRIRGTDFIGAQVGVPLVNSDLWQSGFRRADLAGADVSLARLTGADLSSLPETPISMVDSDLTRANLSRSGYLLGTAQRAVLADAELWSAWLSLDLRNGALRRINAIDSVWAGSDLRRADLSGAQLRESSFTATKYPRAGIGLLHSANMQAANLSGASMFGADLFGVDLRWADLLDVGLQQARLPAADLRGANLTGADLTGANLRGARLDDAVLTGVTWADTTCPDGSNSDDNGGTCAANLDPSSQRRQFLPGAASAPVRPAPRWQPLETKDVIEELGNPEIPFVVLGPRVAIDGTVWVEVDTLSGSGWVDGSDLRPWEPERRQGWAACDADAMFDAVAELIGDPARLERVVVNECADGVARATGILVQPPPAENEQVFLEDVAGEWTVFSAGTGIDCQFEPPGPQRDVCRRLGLWTPLKSALVFLFDERRIATGIPPLTAPVFRDVSAYDPAAQALEWLFAAPIREPDLGLVFIDSEATGFKDFTIVDGVARLTLTGGCDSKGSTFAVDTQIHATLTQFPDIEFVKIFDPSGQTADPDGRSDSAPDCLQP